MKVQCSLAYSYAKVFYGIFIIWYGLNLINNEKNVENVKFVSNSFQPFTILANNTSVYKNIKKELKPYVSLNKIGEHSFEIINFIGILLIFGGFLAACGYGISYNLIMLGLLLDLFFIHNLVYYANEAMKINLMKILSLIGGAYFLI